MAPCNLLTHRDGGTITPWTMPPLPRPGQRSATAQLALLINLVPGHLRPEAQPAAAPTEHDW
jgi:hypothetical protein